MSEKMENGGGVGQQFAVAPARCQTTFQKESRSCSPCAVVPPAAMGRTRGALRTEGTKTAAAVAPQESRGGGELPDTPASSAGPTHRS